MVVVLTADEFLRKGLELVGFDHRRQQQVCRATNLSRFKGHYGSNPNVYAQIWEDLQMADEALEDSWKMDPDSFIMALHFLTHYPTEQEQSGLFKICEKTALSSITKTTHSKFSGSTSIKKLSVANFLHNMALAATRTNRTKNMQVTLDIMNRNNSF